MFSTADLYEVMAAQQSRVVAKVGASADAEGLQQQWEHRQRMQPCGDGTNTDEPRLYSYK